MRVVVFTKSFWPEGGGAELATYLVAKNVLSKHFDTAIVSGTERPDPGALRCCGYVQWPVLRTSFKPVEWIKLAASARALGKLVEGADVVYIPSHTLLPLATAAKKVKPGIKVILHLHNYQPLTYTSVVLAGREPSVATDIAVERHEHDSLLRAVASGLGHYANKLVHKLALHHADKAICASRRQHEILTKHAPELRSKAVVVYNPPPPVPNVEKRPDKVPLMLYSGGGSYVKGFHVLVAALSRVVDRHDFRIYILSYGRSMNARYEGVMREAAQKASGKLVLLGRLAHEDLLALHRGLWALLFPSISEEPMPYAVVESMLLGTIPVASRVGGVVELLQGTPAEEYMFAPGDVDELIDRVERVATLSREGVVDVGAGLREEAARKLDAEMIERELLRAFA